jgi:hypothetical protein
MVSGETHAKSGRRADLRLRDSVVLRIKYECIRVPVLVCVIPTHVFF